MDRGVLIQGGLVVAAIGVLAMVANMVRNASTGTLGRETIMRRNASMLGILAPMLLVAAVAVKPFQKGVTASVPACLNNLRQLSTGLLLYAEDQDGLPPADIWFTASAPYVLVKNPQIDRCGETKSAYAFFAPMGSAKPADNGLRPLLFESSLLLPNGSGGSEAVLRRPRHEGGVAVATVDGAARVVPVPRAEEMLK